MHLRLLRFLRPFAQPFSSHASMPSPEFLSGCVEISRNRVDHLTPRRGDKMGHENSHSILKKIANFRLCKVKSNTTELLEIQSDNPTLHVVFIPGNPGVVTFYKDFVESLYELLGGTTSITAIGHISFTSKNWERGKLFSLQQQIDHKVDFIEQENIKVPIVLIGHSIGAHMSLEMLRRSCEKVVYFVGLYPFLTMNPSSEKQAKYQKITKNSVLSTIISFAIGTMGWLPKFVRRYIVSKSIGKTWSPSAIDATCTHLVKYHTFRNMLFLANSEFRKLSEAPDWEFMRENKRKISFLFGIGDHWGPLHMFEEMSKQVPKLQMSIEREGHTHSFCVTEAGSTWVAQHVANLIHNCILQASS